MIQWALVGRAFDSFNIFRWHFIRSIPMTLSHRIGSLHIWALHCQCKCRSLSAGVYVPPNQMCASRTVYIWNLCWLITFKHNVLAVAFSLSFLNFSRLLQWIVWGFQPTKRKTFQRADNSNMSSHISIALFFCLFDGSDAFIYAFLFACCLFFLHCLFLIATESTEKATFIQKRFAAIFNPVAIYIDMCSHWNTNSLTTRQRP